MEYILQTRDNKFVHFECDNIHSMVATGSLTLNDFIFSIKENRWDLVGNFVDFRKYIPPPPTEIPVISSKVYYLQGREGVLGPYSEAALFYKLYAGEIGAFDYIFLRGEKRWILLKDIDAFSRHFVCRAGQFTSPIIQKINTNDVTPPLKEKSVQVISMEAPDEKVPEPPVKDESISSSSTLAETANGGLGTSQVQVNTYGDNHFKINNDKIWIYVKNRQENGPHTFVEILQLVKEGKLNSSTMLRRKFQTAWQRMKDIHEFNTNVIKKIVVINGQQIEELFSARAHQRINVSATAVIKFKDQDYRAKIKNISIGGCGVDVEVLPYNQDDVVEISIFPAAGEGFELGFSCQARVAFLKTTPPYYLGLQFINIDDETKTLLEEFVKKD